MVLDRVLVCGSEKVIWRQTDNVGFILHGDGGMREHMISKGIAPRDHIKANKLQIKNMQPKRKEEEPRKHVNKKHIPKPNQHRAKPVIPSLPLHLLNPPDTVIDAPNYTCNAPRHPTKNEDNNLFKTNKNFGKLPQYLKNRKLKIAEEKRQEDELHNQPPPGLRYATEDERQVALQTLVHKVIVGLLLDLPLIADTYGLQRKKEFLDKKLEDIENAIALYSQPKVCIPI